MSRAAPISTQIFEPGERILWQGRPRVRLDLGTLLAGGVSQMWIGLFMIAFALFWIIQTSRDGAPFIFPLFGLLFLGQGVVSVARPVIWPLFLRSRSYYTLTDRTAYVVTDVPGRGRRMTSTPVGSHTPVEWVDSDPPTIIFGTEGTAVSFHNIDDAGEVMRLIREMQAGGMRAANASSDWQGGSDWGERSAAAPPPSQQPPPLPNADRDNAP